MSGKKIAIIYKSLTGNTRQVQKQYGMRLAVKRLYTSVSRSRTLWRIFIL